MTHPHHELPTCQFRTGVGEGIGAPGEYEHEEGGLYCEAEAESVVRPKGGWHIREYGQRAVVCHEHAVYLVEDAPADWDMIAVKDEARVREAVQR